MCAIREEDPFALVEPVLAITVQSPSPMFHQLQNPEHLC